MLSERNSKNIIIIGIILALCGLLLFIWNFSYSPDQNVDSEKIAQFGDYFGGIIGSIWSLAGVILFYVALQEQRKDIDINRNALEKQIEEFELQRGELSETRRVFEEQSQTLKVQRFENTFFQLLNLHHEIVNNLQLQFPYDNDEYTKREVFKRSVNKLIHYFNNYETEYKYNSETHRSEIVVRHNLDDLDVVYKLINKQYNYFYFEDTNQLLSHYYRSIYHIFKFIYKTDLIDKDQKQFYATLLRAQLSSDELFLILYNSLDLGYPNFLFLIKEYDILQNFDFGLLKEFKNHKNLYEKLKIELPITIF